MDKKANGNDSLLNVYSDCDSFPQGSNMRNILDQRTGITDSRDDTACADKSTHTDTVARILSDENGPYFGKFGGRFVAEALISALEDLDIAWQRLREDPDFRAELSNLERTYSGRPSIITEVPRFAKYCGSARVFLKREDINHTGSHKINNVIGQAILTREIGKSRVIAETGAGQHGVATATAAALLGIDCTIYMGQVDMERQALNVARMRLLGAEVVGVNHGSATLKDAINEAFRDWVTNVDTTNYIFGTAAGPHPFPAIVRDIQKVISEESRAQMQTLLGKLPDYVIACVGGGSNAIGSFHAYIDDEEVKLVGVEAAGDGIDTKRTAASIETGTPGVLHGSRTFLLQDSDGQTLESGSISAGIDYPGVGPEHAWIHDIGRAKYIGATDDEAMKAFSLLSRTEGIIPAIESAHALAGAISIGIEAQAQGESPVILVTLSGRGDKDMETAGSYFNWWKQSGKEQE